MRYAARGTSGARGRAPGAVRPVGVPILTCGGAPALPGCVLRVAGASPAVTTVGRVRYPEAPRLDLVEHLHGHAVADPYRWLEDPADPRTASWTRSEERRVGKEGRSRWSPYH